MRPEKEIEIKLRIRDAPALRKKLRTAGARPIRRVHEMNTLFDTPRGALRKRGILLRLRVETPVGQKRSAATIVTLKGPSQANRKYKVREEINLGMGDVGAGLKTAPTTLVERALEMLGFHPAVRYEKFRESFLWPGLRPAGGFKVEWDETPIGDFLELEGPPRVIDRVARRLGYAAQDYIRESYLALHAQYCRARGIVARGMLFRRSKRRAGQRISA
jgi:adenylate cyclase class 2